MAISIVLGFYGISSVENVISSQNSAGNLLELSVFLSRLGYMLQEFLKVQHLCLDNHTHSSGRAYVEFGSFSCAFHMLLIVGEQSFLVTLHQTKALLQKLSELATKIALLSSKIPFFWFHGSIACFLEGHFPAPTHLSGSDHEDVDAAGSGVFN